MSQWEIYLHLVNVYGARVMRCGCGRMISTTAGQTLTTSRDADAQERLLRMTACVVQVSVADRTETWSWLTWPEIYIYFTGYWAQHYPRPSRLRRGLCTVCTQAPHKRRKVLPFRTFCPTVDILNQSSRAVRAVHFYGDKKWINHTKHETKIAFTTWKQPSSPSSKWIQSNAFSMENDRNSNM